MKLRSTRLFIRSLRIGFVGLVLSVATVRAGPSAIQGVVKGAKGQSIKGQMCGLSRKDGKQLFNMVKTDVKGRYISQGWRRAFTG